MLPEPTTSGSKTRNPVFETPHAAGVHGWTAVDNLAAKFYRHGITAESERWFRTFQDTMDTQGDTHGILHPNELGHRAFADALLEKIVLR